MSPGRRDRSGRSLANRMRRRCARGVCSLTARETEVMAWVVAACVNKQVAAELGISEETSKCIVCPSCAKMQADFPG